ncbi:hypothetical protein J2R99_000738 [Rhodopseudomonas julia]|uniref:Uncharacterized protein n=1 Tax=Rhodopseudomonas julia TaxID=200617 RepID=A0ABU0C2Z6_9BRAD|nr:hypothetical protein [Rhodopseudomonas julia]MDQ0324889.1 hypothetical protein [Rhodopseudomonas julia]
MIAERKREAAGPERRTGPNIGRCRLNTRRDFCIEDVRNDEQMETCRQISEELLWQVLSTLPKRRSQIGEEARTLDWNEDEMQAFLQNSLLPQSGRWVFGLHGALGEFRTREGDLVDRDGNFAVACVHGAVRLRERRRLRAFEWRQGAAIILALARKQIVGLPNACLASLGRDEAAIREEDRDARLFDLGIGSAITQFCLRTRDPLLIRRLSELEGEAWPLVLSRIGRDIQETSPHRVIASPIGRMEVFSPIQAAGGRPPKGPHTRFFPADIAMGRELPPGVQIPAEYAPCAIFYPTGRTRYPGGLQD